MASRHLLTRDSFFGTQEGDFSLTLTSISVVDNVHEGTIISYKSNRHSMEMSHLNEKQDVSAREAQERQSACLLNRCNVS